MTIDPASGSSVILDGLSWPQSDGSAKQVLRTDGSGSLSWTGIGAADSIKSDDIKVGDAAVNISTSSGSVTIDPASGSSVILDGLSWPQSDGSAKQVLRTDGSGSLSWTGIGVADSIKSDDIKVGDAAVNMLVHHLIGKHCTGTWFCNCVRWQC